MKGQVISIEVHGNYCTLVVGIEGPQFELGRGLARKSVGERSRACEFEEYKKAKLEHEKSVLSFLRSLTLGEIDFHYPRNEE